MTEPRPLTLYNTLTREKAAFTPLNAKQVGMYVCGPTVYDFAHIGNARPPIVFDVLYRLLRHIYGLEHVTYVRNITDVDDKINARAARDYPDLPLNDAIRKVTEQTARQFQDDTRALGCLAPNHEPRATENLPEMRDIIDVLIEKGHAYVAEDHVLFDVASAPDYGRLSKRSLDEMMAGARVDVAPYKRSPMDFVLWKPSDASAPGWPSPGGIKTEGRPGWHIECSAMSKRYLGEMFDIHGGGIDLPFPHHENERAQSCCAHGTSDMAQVWMHNGFLQVEGEKMSKSLGNFVTIRELLEGWRGKAWPGEVIRLAMLSTQYRQPFDFSVRLLEESWKTLDGWYAAIGETEAAGSPGDAVLNALSDDLNTPLAIAALHALKNETKNETKNGALAAASLKASANMLGLLERTQSEWLGATAPKVTVDEAKVEALIAARKAARAQKDFAKADALRGELEAMGIALKDSKDKETGAIVTTWELKR